MAIDEDYGEIVVDVTELSKEIKGMYPIYPTHPHLLGRARLEPEYTRCGPKLPFFHENTVEEWWIMLEGTMQVEFKGIENIFAEPGDIVYAPPNIPHRPAGKSELIIIEAERRTEDEQWEKMQIFCDECGDLIDEREFNVADNPELQYLQYAVELYANEEIRTCDNDGWVDPNPRHPEEYGWHHTMKEMGVPEAAVDEVLQQV